MDLERYEYFYIDYLYKLKPLKLCLIYSFVFVFKMNSIIEISLEYNTDILTN